MPIYHRTTVVNAIQFFEEQYAVRPEMYPDVRDKAMLSELWWGKTAKDGRYYLSNPTNGLGFFTGITDNGNVYDGDYIIREESGVVYTLTQEDFEKNHKLLN